MSLTYRMVVPPGWQLLPVRDRTDEELRALIVDNYRDLPRDSSGPFIARLADAVVEQAGSARRAGVIDLLFPLGSPWRAPVTTSIAVAIGSGTTPEGDRVETAPVNTEAGDASRTITELEHSSPGKVSAVRRVEYTWPLPDESGNVMIGTATLLSADDPDLSSLVEALTELSEVILSTIRWHREDDPA